MKILSSQSEITFDDILLLPGESDFSIDDEKKHISLKTKLSRNVSLDVPIVAAPMSGISEDKMAIALGKMGGVAFIHPFQSKDRQLDIIHKVKKQKIKVAVSVGDLSLEGDNHVQDLIKQNVDLICTETAHAFNRQTLEAIKRWKKKFKKIEVCASLVVTAEATEALIRAGADSIRAGIGGGSHCTTRLVTGVGRPQLSTVSACAKITQKYKIPLISDTGIKHSGDIIKALAFGADTVMIGGLFAGTDEAPGYVIKKKGKLYKKSWGNCTNTAMNHHQLFFFIQQQNIINRARAIKRRLLKQKPVGMDLFEEGIAGDIPYKGSVIPILEQMVNACYRSLWYQGFKSISELQQKAQVVLVSANTQQENRTRI